jgi:Flp pilus assembly protein TadD
MSLHEIGRMEEAKAALEQLRQLCKQEDLIWNMDVQGVLAEAEKLLSGEKQ